MSLDPKEVTGTPNLYVETIYPHFVREAVSRGEITTLNSTLIYKIDAAYTDFATGYTHAITPWIVSRVVGGTTNNLYFIEITFCMKLNNLAFYY